MMRQDRFTEGAQEVLAASQEMVRKAKHSQWDLRGELQAYRDRIIPAVFDGGAA